MHLAARGGNVDYSDVLKTIIKAGGDVAACNEVYTPYVYEHFVLHAIKLAFVFPPLEVTRLRMKRYAQFI